jgi:signal transduction histidine kinase
MHLFSKDFFPTVIKGINISNDFKTYREATASDYIGAEKIDQISIEVKLDKKILKNDKYYLMVISDIDSLISTNAQYTKKNKILTIELDNNTNEKLYFNYKYQKAKKTEFRCDVISEFEYKYLLHNEGILYGVAYGIIFCAFLYYLVIFFSTQMVSFLYYSLMQLFVLLSLIGFVYVSFLSYPNQEYIYTQAVIDIFETLAFSFTVLFAKEILDTKKVMPWMNVLCNIFIIFSVLDIAAIMIYKYSILYKYMAFELAFLLPIIAGVIAIYKKVDYAVIYTFGWSIMFVVVYLSDKFLITIDSINLISSIYTIHIVTPLESLIFSFALGMMLKKIVKEKNEKEKFLIHKSKLASMGEMINNIAHQWKQPLTHLSYINMNLHLASSDKVFDTSYLRDKIEESNNQIDFMSNTIDNFSDFYKPAKDKEKFLISKAVQKSIDIMFPLLKMNEIEIDFKIKKDGYLISYENEYSQVILNLISNAKDELISRKIENPKIIIELSFLNNMSLVSVIDNAGGIKEEKLEKVFEPYFTTKEMGSGIGLYMSKTIIESHFKGDLQVRNTHNGACFQIII